MFKFGGFDIFCCRFDPNAKKFGPVINLGNKINSKDDDILYVKTGDNENATFSSTRNCQIGKINIYKIEDSRITNDENYNYQTSSTSNNIDNNIP